MAVGSFRQSVGRILLAGILPLVAGAAAAPDGVQPDRLDFGVVHVTAKVQGSVRIFADPAVIKASKARVTAPAFVKLDSVDQDTREYDPGNVRGYCDIAVTIDTGKPGKFASPIVVQLGERRVEVAVRADVRPRTKALARVLVAETPFQKFSTSDAGVFLPWLGLVERGGFDVDYINVGSAKSVLEGIDLSVFDSVLLGQGGVVRLTSGDVAALRRYAEGGGRLIVTADAFYRGTVAQANRLLIPYGLEIKDTEDPALRDFEVQAPHITPCPLTEGVNKLSFFRPSFAVELGEPRSMILVGSPANPKEHLVAFALAGKGQVASLGQSLWWMWVGKADNAVLMENLLRRRPRAD